MRHTYSAWLPRPLAALGLLLATAGAVQAQTPTTFAAPATYTTGDRNTRNLAVADVNGDGRPDLLTVNQGSGTVGMLLGTGTGTFGAPTIYPTAGNTPVGIAVADVNGDGRLDVLTTNANSNNASVLLGGSNGTFGAPILYSTGAGSSPTSLAVADVNGDNRPDLLTANFGSSSVGVLLGTSTGTFGPVTTYSTGTITPIDLAVADVSNDGQLDVLTANRSGNFGASVLLGTGSGTFGAPALIANTGGANPISLVVVDVSDDGRPDLLVANQGNNTVGVRLGTGTGTFGTPTTFATGNIPTSLVTADVNGDGRLDLLTANSGADNVSVLLGTGPGSFGAPTRYATGGTGPENLVVADVNADGKPDLLTANVTSSNASVLLNTTAFAPVVTTTAGTTTFTPGAGAVVVDNGLTLTDVDNTTISSATVSISGGFVSSQDRLSVTVGASVSGTYTFATGTLVLTGTATVAQYQTILRSVTYNNLTASPNTATRTVSFVANDGSLTSAPATKNITFAATTTVASIVRTGASPTNASTVAYTVTFANAVTGLSTGNFTVNSTNLTGSSVASVSGSGTTYTVTVNTGTLSPGTNGTVQLQFNNSTGIAPVVTNTGFTGPAYVIDRTPPVVSGVVDGGIYNSSRTTSFNEGTATLNGSPFASGAAVSTEGSYTLVVTDAATNTTTVNFTLDLTEPTVASLTRLSPANTINTNQTSVTFRVVFSESVTGVAVGDFFLSTMGGVTGSVTAVTGTGTTYDVTIGGIAGNGTLYPDLRVGSVADLAGNLNTTGITSGQFYLIDNIAPETTITANPPAVTNSTTATFAFTGTDANGNGLAGFQASLDGAAFAAASSPVVVSGLADGAHTFRVRALDKAGNVDATPASYTWTVDTNAPTVLISSNALNPTITSPIPFTVTFSESVTGFAASDVVVTNGTVTGSTVTGSGTTYAFNVTPTASGLVTVSIPANGAADAAGNGNVASSPLSITYSLPMTGTPILSAPATNSTTSGQPIFAGTAPAGSTVTIYLAMGSGAAQVIGTTTATGGSFSLVPSTALASGIYSVYATAQSSGSTVSANSSSTIFTVDATPPTATITTTVGSTTSTSPIPVTVSFSEPIQSFSASSVQVSNGSISSAITTTGNDYSFNVTPTAGGAVTVTLPAGVVRDRFGNANTSASSLSVTYTTPITATSWTGAVSTDWFDAANWTQAVPTATVDATISPVSSGRYPLIAGNPAATRNLTLNAGASLAMSGGTLEVRATLANNGTFAATGGTVVLGTSTTGNIVGSATTSFWNLQVDGSGAALATAAGAAVQQVLTLNGGFSTNGNVFTLRSTAAATALVVNNGGVVSGTTTVQRAIDPSVNPGLGYRHYSSPVSNSTVGDLATSGFTPVVNPAYNTSPMPGSVVPYPTVFGYDDARLATTATSNNLSSFDKGYFSPSALSDPLAPGRGYTVNIAASEVVDFVGTLTNGDQTLNLTSTRPSYPDGGWQLLGNPYPAPLDYSRVAPADRRGLDGAIYVYSSTSQYTGRYRTYVNGIGSPVLPVAQGFFARVASGVSTATMTFHNSQRLTAPDPTTFQRTAASADPRPLVQLELRATASAVAAAAVADEFFAYAEAGATPAFDPAFDAEKLPNPTGFNLASIAPSGPSLAVDARPAFTAATVLPLSLGVPAPGPYALSAANLANLPAGLDAYLADDLTGQLTRLSLGTSYAFSVSASQAAAPIAGRFRLLFRPATALATTASLSAADVAVFPNPARARFTVVLPGLSQASTVQAELLNALGQVVRLQTVVLPASGTQLSFDTAELATGVYILRLQAGATNLAKRIVLE